MKKVRNKKYFPKGTVTNTLAIFGGMLGTHGERLQAVQLKSHQALAEIVQGRGTRDHWNLVVGAVNMANVMCDMGIGAEYRPVMLAARDAMMEIGKRAALCNRFVFKGDELKTVNEMMDMHDAQLENIRAVDVDRAVDEVMRRVKNGHKDNRSVVKELATEAA